MNTLFDVLAALSILIGLFFFLVGALGVLRLPDVYHRLHAASKCSTLGLMGLLLGLMFHMGGTSGAVDAKAVAVVAFLFLATPIGSHVLAKAALRSRHAQWSGTLSDDHAEDGLS